MRPAPAQRFDRYEGVIDSTHGGEGRQLYLIDVAEIVLS